MKKVISVTINDDGSIKGLLFEGNKAATPLKTVIKMLTNGREIDFADSGLEVVNRASGPYVRTKANDTTEDNLGTMVAEAKAEEKVKDELWEEVKASEKTKPGFLARFRAWLKG